MSPPSQSEVDALVSLVLDDKTDAKDKFGRVGGIARNFLSRNNISSLSTTALVLGLIPRVDAQGIEARKKLADLLLRLAKTELADCARRGDAGSRKYMGRTVRPWLWSTPAAVPQGAVQALVNWVYTYVPEIDHPSDPSRAVLRDILAKLNGL